MISCLMVTQASKLDLARHAIRDFHRQTFADRELVIVHDSGARHDVMLRALAATYPSDEIRVVQVSGPQRLGALRNVSLDEARYPLICQWDDDDRYHPHRLQVQFDQLLHEDSDFCFLTDQLHWYTERDWFFWDDWNVEPYPMNLIQGTMLGKKALLGSYPDLARGEDTVVVVDLIERGCRVATVAEQGYLYLYTFNGRNAWELSHHAAISRWKRFRLERLQTHSATLIRYLTDYELPLTEIQLPHESGMLVLPLPPAESS